MDSAERAFEVLSYDTGSLFAPRTVHQMTEVPSEIDFLRNYINQNFPLLIKGAAKHWPACSLWKSDYLIDKLENKMVTVAVTPNGYADAITTQEEEGETKEYFVTPEERTMRISDLFAKLEGKDNFIDTSVRDSGGIFYLQKQDSNLVKELPELLPDIDASLSWATKAFGAEPSAINIWMGDSRSVTCLHKDPFENIYCVVSGYKDFILLPPTDRPWLKYKFFNTAQYREEQPGKFVIEPVPLNEKITSLTKVPWITTDPLKPVDRKYLEFAHPVHVRVEAGDVLYLPSLWFHHVRQSDGCIAVNFWYDMVMDVKYVYYHFLEDLCMENEEREEYERCIAAIKDDEASDDLL